MFVISNKTFIISNKMFIISNKMLIILNNMFIISNRMFVVMNILFIIVFTNSKCFQYVLNFMILLAKMALHDSQQYHLKLYMIV